MRLTSHLRATSVDLDFELDPSQKTFRGHADYRLRIEKRSRRIEFHSADLRVSNVRLQFEGALLKGRVEARPDHETIVLHFDRLLPLGDLALELDFRGRVRSDLRGLYRSEDTQRPWLATQLCPTDARRLFPCFDEPGIKSCYRVRVTVPRDQNVISNSPIRTEEQAKPGWKTVVFETTPPLSAYLLAIAVGPFTSCDSVEVGSTEIRVYTLPGREKLARFALEAAAQSLARLEAWFDMAHPYPKLDLLALPDFAFGAMENAGAVFFRDSILLLDADLASSADLKQAAETIAHELSHMWFGNLVTMAWWNALWLNESFATWMAYEIIEDWRPNWHIWLDFAQRREIALEVDALATSHPIAPQIRSAEEAHENFDAITYTKGASVLRMLSAYLGPDVFRDGIRLYIRRHRESAASAEDLWAALGEVSGLEIGKIVSPWTLQTGYPVLNLRRRKTGGRDGVEFRQERFLSLTPRGGRAKSVRPRWTVPWVGRFGTALAKEPRTLRHLLVKTRDHRPARIPEQGWLYGNADEIGFFRVDYGESELDDVLANVSRLAPIERIGFVGHQWALARAGRLPIARLLDLLAALGDEQDPDVLLAIERVLVRLGRRLGASRGTLVLDRLRAWVSARFENQAAWLELEADRHADERQNMRRARILSILGHFARSTSLRQECTRRCAEHLSAGVPLPPESADEIVRIAASAGDDMLHRRLVEATRSAATPQVRRRSIFALAEFEQPRLVRASLSASLDTRLAPAGDRAGLLAALLAAAGTAPATWLHLQKHWPRLEKQMPPILLARLAAGTADALPHSAASEISAFFRAHPLAAGSRVLRQVAEEMAIAKRFEAQSGQPLEDYLESH